MKKALIFCLLVLTVFFQNNAVVFAQNGNFTPTEDDGHREKTVLANPSKYGKGNTLPDVPIDLQPLAICGPLFCLDDGGGGGGASDESMGISISNYGVNSTYKESDPEDTWTFYFTPEKSEYYQFKVHTYPNTLDVDLYQDTTLIASGETDNTFIEDSNNENEFFVMAGVQYKIKVYNDNNLTDIYVYVYRDDNNNEQHPKMVSTYPIVEDNIDYHGDVDYFIFSPNHDYMRLYSEVPDTSIIDLESTLYWCSTIECGTPFNPTGSNDAYLESGYLWGDMTALDFGYDYDFTGIQSLYFLLVVSESTTADIGLYNIIKDEYDDFSINISSNSWVSDEMYPNEDLFDYFGNLGIAYGSYSETITYPSGYDEYRTYGYYKYSYTVTGEPNNIYTVWYDWYIQQYRQDTNTFLCGVEYTHADIYKLDTTTNEVSWYGAVSPTYGDLSDIVITYSSDNPVASFTILDNASYSEFSYEDAFVAFATNILKSTTKNVYIEGLSFALDAYLSGYNTYTYENIVYYFEGDFLESNDITILSSNTYTFTLAYEDNYYSDLHETYILHGNSYDGRTAHSKLVATSYGEYDPFFEVSFEINVNESIVHDTNGNYIDSILIYFNTDGTMVISQRLD